MREESEKTTLDKIQKSFAEHRAVHGKRRVHYPLALRQLAVSAVNSGIIAGKVVNAAGISRQSIRIWEKSSTIPQPKRLRVTSADARGEIQNFEARIELAEDVVIKLPIEALTGELLQRLRGGET